MKQFQNVIKYSATCDSAKKLVEMAEDYAKSKSNEMFKTNFATYSVNKDNKPVDLNDKAKQLNEVFCSELARRSKYSLADFDNDVQAYSASTVVSEMSAQLQKILVDAMTPILISASNLELIAEFHYGGYGDTFEFELNDPLPYNVSKIGARQKHTKTQEKKRQNKTIDTEFYGLTTYATLPQILVGESMVAEDAFLKALSINKKVYTLIVKKFVSACATIADSNFVQSGYTETALLQKLRGASAYNGAPVVIVGDAVALKTLLPSESRVEILLQDEYNTTLGYMSIWNTYKTLGFDVVADPNEANGVLGLPTNRLYGIPVNGRKLIQVAIGATIANTDDEWDNNNLAILDTLRKEIGVELATNKKVVRCDLS